MQLAQLISYFETSPAMRLLRSTNAPFIVDFLYRQFKGTGRLTMAMSDLLAGLAEYREDIHETYPDKLRDKPEQYLSESWSMPWIRKIC